MPKSTNAYRGASAARWLRASRPAQLKRRCARSARVHIRGAPSDGTEHGASVDAVMLTRWRRNRVAKACLIRRPDTSPHSNSRCSGGWEGGGATSRGDWELTGCMMRFRTALTRRGCAPDACRPRHAAARRQPRQSPFFARYSIRTLPSESVRRSCGRRIFSAGQRSVPFLSVAALYWLSRVAGRHYCRPAPSERHVRVSPHAAQASQTPVSEPGFLTSNPWLWICRWQFG